MRAETSLQKYAGRKTCPPAGEGSQVAICKMRHCITLPVFGTDVLLMDDLFGQSMKPGVALLPSTSQASKPLMIVA